MSTPSGTSMSTNSTVRSSVVLLTSTRQIGVSRPRRGDVGAALSHPLRGGLRTPVGRRGFGHPRCWGAPGRSRLRGGAGVAAFALAACRNTRRRVCGSRRSPPSWRPCRSTRPGWRHADLHVLRSASGLTGPHARQGAEGERSRGGRCSAPACESRSPCSPPRQSMQSEVASSRRDDLGGLGVHEESNSAVGVVLPGKAKAPPMITTRSSRVAIGEQRRREVGQPSDRDDRQTAGGPRCPEDQLDRARLGNGRLAAGMTRSHVARFSGHCRWGRRRSANSGDSCPAADGMSVPSITGTAATEANLAHDTASAALPEAVTDEPSARKGE